MSKAAGISSYRALGWSCALVLAIGALVVAGGCQTSRAMTNSEEEMDALSEFEHGADRPPSAHTLYHMGGILASQGKERQAEAVLKVAIDRYPLFSPAYRELAELFVRRRWLDQAATTLEAGIDQVPNDAVLINDLGMVRMLQGDPGLALVHFEQAHEIAPRNARYVSNMAMASGLVGEYDRSIELYSQVVSPALAHYNVAVLCESQGEDERAAQEYEQAMKLDPQYIKKLQSEDEKD